MQPHLIPYSRPPGRLAPFAALLTALCLATATSSSGAVGGQWDFDAGNLNATTGSPLVYRDGPGGPTEQGTAFNSTTGFGIPDINGEPAQVVRIAAGTQENPFIGYQMPVPNVANGGGAYLNDYTLILDVLFPAASSGVNRAILETDLGLFNPDAEIFVTAANGLGTKSGAQGNVTPDAWHRLAIVVDTTAGQIRTYVDGEEASIISISSTPDDRYALTPGVYAEIFSDDNGETAVAYVNSIQLRDEALSKGQVRALGGPAADGIPQDLPPVPSAVERWTPRGDYAGRDTDLGVVIARGDTTIEDASISLSLDGEVLEDAEITRDGEFITVRVPGPGLDLGSHTLALTYTDSLAGEQSFSKTFTAALFFEDFESVSLQPQKDEAVAFEEAWTRTPPEGWTVDNSQFPSTIIDPENNPDLDGDGFADLDGVTEWAGWSFASKAFWIAAEDQRRSEFTFGEGVIAVADSDEWDDSQHVQSLFTSFLESPPISIEGVAPNSLILTFASSWRPEGADDTGANFPTGPNGEPLNNQTALITASFDGGDPVEVFRWDSISGSPYFHTDTPNERVQIAIPNPEGAETVVLTFGYLDAANDWWWAVDNIALSTGAAPPNIVENPSSLEVTEGEPASITVSATGDSIRYQWFKGPGEGRTEIPGATGATLSIAAASVEDAGYYSVDVFNDSGSVSSTLARLSVMPVTAGRTILLEEDFDSLPLGPSVDEGIPGAEVWTKTPPEGWFIDDSGVPGAGTDDDGVTEWAGWSFADREWWAETAEDQQRSQFTKSSGTAAIADSDEWDDIGHAAGNMATYLSTRPIDIQGLAANSVILAFDSSWRPEASQTANVTVSFDDGEPIEVLRFESNPASGNYRPDEVSETVAVRISNPPDAESMVVTFGYFNTRNNWWWAIDNVRVLAGESPNGDLPALEFSVNGDELTLSWEGEGLTLEQSADLGDPDSWAAVPGVSGNSAVVTMDAGARFFRLSR